MKGIFVAFSLCAMCASASEPPSCQGEPRCDTARTALIAAESAVQEATRKKALWTTAESALAEARVAFARTDYDTAVRAAEAAKELAELGIAQTRYPPFPEPKP